MPTPKKILLLGPGYVGEPVLHELLTAGHTLTVLVRRPDQARLIAELGATVLEGQLDDIELLTSQAAQHDVIINLASSDLQEPVKALLAGMRQRVARGETALFIHTSGAAVLEDGATGRHADAQIYRDDAPQAIDALSISNMHREIDAELADAGRTMHGLGKIVIIMPPLIYGVHSDKDPSPKHSFVLNLIVKAALKHGHAGFVGDGINQWSTVHVRDLARAYVTTLNLLESIGSDVVLDNPYIFVNGSDGDTRFSDLTDIVGDTLHRIGRIGEPKSRSWSAAQYEDVMGPDLTVRGFGSNSRSRGIRLREIGWSPTEIGPEASWEAETLNIVNNLDVASA